MSLFGPRLRGRTVGQHQPVLFAIVHTGVRSHANALGVVCQLDLLGPAIPGPDGGSYFEGLSSEVHSAALRKVIPHANLVRCNPLMYNPLGLSHRVSITTPVVNST